MITKQEHNGNMRVEDYGFAEWLAQVEPLLRSGYKFDFVSNENYPVAYGQMYTASLVLDTDKPQSATTSVLTVQVDTTEVRALIDEKISEVKAMQEEAAAAPKVDGRKKK